MSCDRVSIETDLQLSWLQFELMRVSVIFPLHISTLITFEYAKTFLIM